MRFLLFLYTFCWIASCVRQKPDWDQSYCEKCISYKEIYKDSLQGLISVDTAFNGYLCEGPLAGPYTLTDFKHSLTDTTFKICNSRGELLHWEHIVNKTIK